MIIVGFDPGSKEIGYAILRQEGDKLHYHSAFMLNVFAVLADKDPFVPKRKKDKLVGVEQPFNAKFKATAQTFLVAGAIWGDALRYGYEPMMWNVRAWRKKIGAHGQDDNAVEHALRKQVTGVPDFKGKDKTHLYDALGVALATWLAHKENV